MLEFDLIDIQGGDEMLTPFQRCPAPTLSSQVNFLLIRVFWIYGFCFIDCLELRAPSASASGRRTSIFSLPACFVFFRTTALILPQNLSQLGNELVRSIICSCRHPDLDRRGRRCMVILRISSNCHLLLGSV
jgi:hypothetical protein